jgi:wobble nucleotide-excising tRNase
MADEIINSLDKITNAGILDIQNIELKKHNLVYGYNGSGKTTLSRILSILGNGSDSEDSRRALEKIKFTKDILPECTINGTKFKFNEGENNSTFLHRIQVFNQDFIDRNILPTDGMRKIIVSSKAGDLHSKKEHLEKCKYDIENINEQYNSKQISEVNGNKYKGISELQTLSNKLQIQLENELTNYAKNFVNVGIIRYNKTTLKNDIKKIEGNLSFYKKDTGYDSNWNLDTLMKEARKQVNTIYSDYSGISQDDCSLITTLIRCLENWKKGISDVEVNMTRELKISSQEFQSLSKEVIEWIQDGIKLHNNESKCLFCTNELENRVSILKQTFNNDHQKLKKAIKQAIEQITSLKEQVRNFMFAEDSTIKEQLSALNLGDSRISLIRILDSIKEKLEKKETDKPSSLWTQDITQTSAEDSVNLFINTLKRGLNFYEKHNEKTLDKEKYKEEIYNKIRTWLVIFFLENTSDDGYIKTKLKIELVEAKERELNENLRNIIEEKIRNINEQLDLSIKIDDKNVPYDLVKAISNVKREMANVELALEKIKSYFQNIIQTNIELEVINEQEKIKGFKVSRANGLGIETLSEGEKTALAFAYFLTKIEVDSDGSHLSEENIKKQIIIIDDPISSLDYNVLYSIYNKIYHQIFQRKFGQIIIMTHNWYFANLIIKGFELEQKQRDEKESCHVYQIRRNNKSISSIGECKLMFFKNEYDFLLNYIEDFYYKGLKGEEVDTYNIGNSCRRLAELFSQFHCKEGNRLEELFVDNNGLLRFLHVSSHGENISDKSQIHSTFEECSSNIEEMFKYLSLLSTDGKLSKKWELMQNQKNMIESSSNQAMIPAA